MASVLTMQSLLLMLAHVLGDFYGSLFSPLVPFLRDRLHLSLTAITVLATINMAASNFMQPVFGIAGERLGRSRVLVAGILLSAVSMCALGFASSVTFLAVALLLGGLGTGMFHPCGAGLAGNLSRQRRSAAIAVFMVGGNFGIMASPLVASAVAGTDARWLPLLIPVAVAFAIVFLKAYPDGAAQPARRGAVHAAEVWRVFGKVWPIFVDVVLRFVPLALYAMFLPLHSKLCGATGVETGAALAFFMLVGGAGILAGGYIADRMNGRSLVVGSEIGAGICLVLAPMASGLGYYALLAIGAFLTYAVTPLQITTAQRFAPGAESAASGIVMGLAYGISGVIVMPIGRLGDYWKNITGSELTAVNRMLELGAVFLFAAALLALLLKARNTEKRVSS